MSGAVKYGTEGVSTYRYDYYFSETKAHLDGSNDDLPGYYGPKHRIMERFTMQAIHETAA